MLSAAVGNPAVSGSVLRVIEAMFVSKTQPRKLTFKEGRELEDLPGRIERLEQEQKNLYEQMANPEFYRNHGDRISGVRARVEELGRELEKNYYRWEELENIRDTER